MTITEGERVENRVSHTECVLLLCWQATQKYAIGMLFCGPWLTEKANPKHKPREQRIDALHQVH